LQEIKDDIRRTWYFKTRALLHFQKYLQMAQRSLLREWRSALTRLYYEV